MMHIPLTADLFRGVAEVEETPTGIRLHRLPRWAREAFPDPQLMAMEAQASGSRLAFRTTATAIDLVVHATHSVFRGIERPRGRMDVVVDGSASASLPLDDGDTIEIDPRAGSIAVHPGGPQTVRIAPLPEGEHLVEIWLPHNERLELRRLSADAPIAPDRRVLPVWVHHGSSISQGSNAVEPSGTWTATAARSGHVDLTNLGFGGSAMVDPFVARIIRDTEADFVSLELGINVVNADVMRLRAFVPAVQGFLDTIRDGHPVTPLVLISPLFCGIHEETPGPGGFDPSTFESDQVRYIATGDPADVVRGHLTLEVIRDELRSLVERRSTDGNLHYLDGVDLYGRDDAATLPLPDGIHPSPEAHRLIGDRFAAWAFRSPGPFAHGEVASSAGS